MPDARVSRVELEALVAGDETARVTRLEAEAVVQGDETARVSRVIAEALVLVADAEVRATRVTAEVLAIPPDISVARVTRAIAEFLAVRQPNPPLTAEGAGWGFIPIALLAAHDVDVAAALPELLAAIGVQSPTQVSTVAQLPELTAEVSISEPPGDTYTDVYFDEY